MSNKQLDKSKKYRLGPDVYAYDASKTYPWRSLDGTSFEWTQFKHLYNIGVVTEVAEPITITFKAYPVGDGKDVPRGRKIMLYWPDGWATTIFREDYISTITHWAELADMAPKEAAEVG